MDIETIEFKGFQVPFAISLAYNELNKVAPNYINFIYTRVNLKEYII